jgi:hypothetical protein
MQAGQGALDGRRKEDAMQLDLWYDLAVLEMSGLSDPGQDKLLEAEHAQCPLAAALEESSTTATPELV